MRPFVKSLLPLFALLILSGCGGFSHVKLVDDPVPSLPPNYVDARPDASRHSVEIKTSSYYGDEYLTPPLAQVFLSRLSKNLGNAIGDMQVTLERADVVVTQPDHDYLPGGGGSYVILQLTEPKFVRVDLTGRIGEKPFSHGLTLTVYTGPSASDIRKVVNRATDETIELIRKQLQPSGA